MDTKQIISWLLDKAARAQDHSYARMRAFVEEIVEKTNQLILERFGDGNVQKRMSRM